MLAYESWLNSVVTPEQIAREIYVDNPRVIMCGGGGTGSIPATAVRQPDGGFDVVVLYADEAELSRGRKLLARLGF